MKFAKITLSVALLGALTLGMAEDTVTTEATVSVDAQIEAIQAAPAQERVQLMNQFKQRLATMNEAERTEAIAQLQEKMQTRTRTQTQTRADDATTQTEDAKQAMTQTRTRTQEMVQDKQLQANEQMTQMQNMNQMRAGSQFNHQVSMPNPATTTSGSMNFMNR